MPGGPGFPRLPASPCGPGFPGIPWLPGWPIPSKPRGPKTPAIVTKGKASYTGVGNQMVKDQKCYSNNKPGWPGGPEGPG